MKEDLKHFELTKDSPNAGQWWSIRSIHRPQRWQWCTLKGFKIMQRVHKVGHWIVVLPKVIDLKLTKLFKYSKKNKLTMSGHSIRVWRQLRLIVGRILPICLSCVASAFSLSYHWTQWTFRMKMNWDTRWIHITLCSLVYSTTRATSLALHICLESKAHA